MAKSLYKQAIEAAGLAVAEGGAYDASLEDTATRFVQSADPHSVGGVNSAGEPVLFEWSFGYDDIPAIVAAAEKILAGPADRHKEKPLSLRLGPLREITEQRAAKAGVPVRRFILEAIAEKIEREA